MSLHCHTQNFKGNSGTSLRQKEEFQLFGNNDNDRTTINRPQGTLRAFTKYFENGYVVLISFHNVNYADEVIDTIYIKLISHFDVLFIFSFLVRNSMNNEQLTYLQVIFECNLKAASGMLFLLRKTGNYHPIQ